MKYKFLFLIFSLFFISLTASECKKHKPGNPVDQLPPATQTGAGTIGFLANGQAFTTIYPKVYATYIFTTQDGYSLGINAKGIINDNKWVLNIVSDSLQIEQNKIYLFNNNLGYGFTAKNSFGGGYITTQIYITKPYLQGQLYISHLDSIKQIVSGTFWFDATDTVSNDLVHVTDGRFDLHYTR